MCFKFAIFKLANVSAFNIDEGELITVSKIIEAAAWFITEETVEMKIIESSQQYCRIEMLQSQSESSESG